MEVIVDNSKTPNSRWYSGSGIYRPVWLLLGEEKHIAWQGVKITTESIDPAVVRVQTEHTGGEVKVEVCKGGQAVATAEGDNCAVSIPNAQLWSDETPALYTCRVTLWDGETQVDAVEERFGIRRINWSNKGLFVNGKETLLRGGCVHSDNGILGAKSYKEAEWRRIRKLKELGFNAIRSSHNPCAEEMARQERGQEEKKQRNGVFSYDALDTGETVGLEAMPDSTTPSIEEALLNKELKVCLHRAIESLPRAERELIQAIYFDGLTEREYAKHIGMSQSGVSHRLRKTLSKIRILMSIIGSF